MSHGFYMDNGCKKIRNLFLLIVSLSLYNSSQAAGTGWCQGVTGANAFSFSLNKTITSPDDNKSGTVLPNAYQWSTGLSFKGQCDCDSTFSGVTYVKTEVPLPPSRTLGGLNYFKLNDNIELASEIYVFRNGAGTGFYPTPNSTDNNTVTSCAVAPFATGNAGKLSLYFNRPFVGQLVIPETKILNIYMSKTKGSFSAVPISYVTFHGMITVPQSCSINAGQVINIDLGDMRSDTIATKGAMPSGKVKDVNVTLDCSNIAAGTKVLLSVNGQAAAGDNTALATNNKDIGIRLTDGQGATISPNSGRLPVTMDYSGTHQLGSSLMKVAPINVTGSMPIPGPFKAVAIINAELQ